MHLYLGALRSIPVVDGRFPIHDHGELSKAVTRWSCHLASNVHQVLWRPFHPEAWASVPALALISALACLILCGFNSQPGTRGFLSALPVGARLGLCWLPILQYVTHHVGSTVKLRLLPYGHSPHMAASNCMLWLLTTSRRAPLLDATCAVGLLAAAVANTDIWTHSGSTAAPAATIQPWQALLQTAIAAVLGAILRSCLSVLRSLLPRWEWGGVRAGATAGGVGITGVSGFRHAVYRSWLRSSAPVQARAADLAAAAGAGGCSAAAVTSAVAAVRTPAAQSDRSDILYAEALRVVKTCNALPYSHVAQTSQVHVRIRGLQPEQLRPGWSAELEEHLAKQGLCLLSVSVRRGSILFSFSLANLRFRQPGNSTGGQDNADTPAAAGGTDAPYGSNSSSDGSSSSEAEDSAARQLGPDVGLLTGPEELMAGLGMRREELPAGFTFTVQAVTNDGCCQRASYSLSPDGEWSQVPLWRDDTIGPMEQCGTAHTHGAATPPTPPRGPSHGDGSRRGSSSSSSDRSTAIVGVEGSRRDGCLTHSRRHVEDESASSQGSANLPPAIPFEWALETPLLLVGRSDGQRGPGLWRQRFDADVVLSLLPGVCCLGGAAGAGPHVGCCPACDTRAVEFRARPLDLVGEVAEFRVEQTLVPGSAPACWAATVGRPAASGGSGTGSGLSAIAGPCEAAGAEDAAPTDSGSTSAGAAGTECDRGAAWRGGAAWTVTIWDEELPGLPRVPPSRSTGGRSTREIVQDPSAPVAGPRQGAAERPHLVDLSVWRGHELLAARVVLLVPGGAVGDGVGQPVVGQGGNDPWVAELQDLLVQQPPDAAQHVVVDAGLLLSGALAAAAQPGAAMTALTVTAAAATAASELGPRPVTLGRTGTAKPCQRLLVLLDLGCNVLSLVLKHGACALAARLWSSMLALGFSAEELLLHAAGMRGVMPPLHAAVASGEPAAVDLVLSWYAAASLPEPWLQPIGVSGMPAVLTPLVLASASSPSGGLLAHILRSHSQALDAWNVPVNGASGRSAAAAAGLRGLVRRADLWAALSPAAALAAAAGRWWARRGWRLRRLVALYCRTDGSPARGAGWGTADSEGRPHRAGSPARVFPLGGRRVLPPGWKDAAARREVAAGSAGRAVDTRSAADYDVDMFIFHRVRCQMLLFQGCIIAFQTLSHLKALIGTFYASCPLAAATGAAGGAWPWLSLLRATCRCLLARYWWTVIEAAMAGFIASPYAVRHYTWCCVTAGLARCAFQGLEGGLLPPSGMTAVGGQFQLAYTLFVLVAAFSYQPPWRLNAVLRFMEGLCAARLYLKYQVTSDLRVALGQGLLVNGLGWAVSALLRNRVEWLLRERSWQGSKRQQPSQQYQQQREQRRSVEEAGGPARQSVMPPANGAAGSGTSSSPARRGP